MTAVGDDKWCILRTSAARTLPLAESLAAAGFEVWTPRETQRRRIHRARKAEEDCTVAIAPSFVFAKAESVPDLVTIIAAPFSQHPRFSLFRYAGRVPLIAAADLNELRRAEERAAHKQKRSQRYIYPRGAHVRVEHQAFGGLIGIVQDCDGKHARVALTLFGKPFEMKIATWLLRTDDVTKREPSGIAA
ncbi:transcription termination/antitermination protein NusG [Sphingomonas nostoxanthinifaciens]|uniref:transcription termination/antitermination protein NusG n=1 Tax=Sphingomonas nostoxanthinifaciens TaxID=2872652 RepID=UPI001CC1EEFA|nr:hypothetical protein [Sphingomonas nostoxanthinifaciens]UAK23655.1 hypothetical protein K8P63_14870 [Sphingomonas nostoxanthinifaciens]